MKTITTEQFKADCLKVIEAYHSDLDIDLDTINQKIPAIFYAYECGSHSVSLFNFEQYPPQGERVPFLFGSATRETILEQVGSSIEAESVRGAKLVHYFNGFSITKIDHAKAAVIIRDYKAKMWIQFRKYNGLKVAA